MRWVVALGCCWLSGCKLDSFLYSPERIDAYVLDPVGDGPDDTVSADRIEPLRITVDDTVSLGAVYVKGNVQPPKGYVLFFHGKGGQLGQAFHRPKRFSNYGYDVLAFDYRGWGTSTDVEPTEAGLDADGHAAAEYLRNRVGADSRIIYWGDSFGTAPATQRAHAEPPRALILEEPFASVQYFVSDASAMDVADSFLLDAEWNTAGRVRDLHLPLLILHGTEDATIKHENSAYIFSKANEPKELVWMEGGTHGHLHEVTTPVYREVINRFLDARVP